MWKNAAAFLIVDGTKSFLHYSPRRESSNFKSPACKEKKKTPVVCSAHDMRDEPASVIDPEMFYLEGAGEEEE